MNIEELGVDTTSIPIAVDTVKDVETYRMTRCTYFSIENSESTSVWTLHTQNVDLNFFMMGLSGVVTSPPGDDQLFDAPGKLDNLFNEIERNDELFVEISDIWLPNELFDKTGVKPKRGHVYRIGHDLFKVAYMLRDEARSEEEFLRKMKQSNIQEILEFSDSETSALSGWNQSQIDINQKLYHENPETKLRKKDNNEKPLPPQTR